MKKARVAVWVWALAVAAGFPGFASAAGAPDTAVTTVFLVRHAEKNTHAPGGDAGLSAQGQLRARELARVLSGTRLDAVYSTSFGRARMTAETVARDQRDSVTVYDPEHPEKLAELIRNQQRGGFVLVVGHGDTLPQTYEALTGEAFPDGQTVPYDKLYVVILTASGGHRLLTLRYGAPAS